MRISYLSSSFVPSRAANSVHVMKICNAMSALGHDVILNVATRNPLSRVKDEDFIHYGARIGGFRLVKHWFPRFGFTGRLIYSVQTILPGLISGVDLYYSRHPYSLLFAALTGRPFILEMHAPPIDSREYHIINWLTKKANCRGIVVISDALKQIYLELFPGILEEKIITAHDGADIPSPITKNEWAPLGRPNAIKCGYTGHLYAGRGIDVILATASHLPHIDFHIVGGTDSDIDKWRSSTTLTNVYFYGHLPPALIPEVLNSMDILLAPYQIEVSVSGGRGNTVTWMSPLKIFEYMAASKPIVCSDLPVLREVLVSEINCLLVTSDGIEEWTAAIRRLALDISLQRRLASTAFSEFEKHYSWSARASRLIRELGH